MSEGSFVSPGIIVQFEKYLWIIASFSDCFLSAALINSFVDIKFDVQHIQR